MDENLRVEFERCLDLLGSNDLDINNCLNPLNKQMNSFQKIDRLLDDSKHRCQEIRNESALHDDRYNRLSVLLQAIQDMKNETNDFSSHLTYLLERIHVVLGRNHEVFMTISKLIAERPNTFDD